MWFNVVSTVIRLGLTIVLLYLVYLETGLWTALTLTLIAIALELISIVLGRLILASSGIQRNVVRTRSR